MKFAGFEDKLLAKLDKLDIDQIQQVLGQILGQKQFFGTLLDHLDEGVVVTNRALELVFANRRARTMLGWRRRRGEEGEDLLELVAADHPLRELLESLRGNPRSIDAHECTYGRNLDRQLAVTTLTMQAGDSRPRPAGEMLIILLRDVTDRYLRQAEQARAQRFASMATLTAGIAHEIKNPLNSLNIHAQLLQGEIDQARSGDRPPDLTRTERASQVILEETARLSRIIDEFIQAARPRSPRLEPCDLAALLQSTARLFAPECERHGVQFTLHIEPDLPPVHLDEHQVVQALRNLVRNAVDALVDFRPRARERDPEFEPGIELSARLAGDHIELTVADNGPGIPDEILEHIFEPYFTTKFSGTGLGLMVVYRIVTEHGGTLHVDSDPARGTLFTLNLPLHQRPVRLLETQGPPLQIASPTMQLEVATPVPDAADPDPPPRK